MSRDEIAEIAIDAAGQLHVVPMSHVFPHIYREAMNVQWDPESHSLHSPPPTEWSYARWFQQILAAARAQECELYPNANTIWRNVAESNKAEFLQVTASRV
jgi:hypothetical protein